MDYEQEPIAVSVNQAVNVSGLSRSKIYELIKEGRIKTRQIGRRRLIIMSSLRALLEYQEEAA